MEGERTGTHEEDKRSMDVVNIKSISINSLGSIILTEVDMSSKNARWQRA